jgi:hypothetical protein
MAASGRIEPAGSGERFADTGLDWEAEEDFSRQEKERLLNWYRNVHGSGDLNLVKFAPFLIEHLPAAFKLSRRHLVEIPQPVDGVGLPDAALILCYLHSYCAVAYESGILYQLISARHLGASKALVMDVLQYAYLSTGPRGFNAVAEVAHEYLAGWAESEESEDIDWPQGWAPDPSVFRSQLDESGPDLSSAEVASTSGRHGRMSGVVPRHVHLFSRLHPSAFKIQRIRYEHAVGSVMPAQLAPLLTLHLAAMRLQPAVMRQALSQARTMGVRRHHIVQTVFTGLRHSADPMVMEATAEAIHEQLAGWDE